MEGEGGGEEGEGEGEVGVVVARAPSIGARKDEKDAHQDPRVSGDAGCHSSASQPQ